MICVNHLGFCERYVDLLIWQHKAAREWGAVGRRHTAVDDRDTVGAQTGWIRASRMLMVIIMTTAVFVLEQLASKISDTSDRTSSKSRTWCRQTNWRGRVLVPKYLEIVPK